MQASPNGRKLIRSFEKCSLKAYQKSTDPWTIGWGNTFYEDGSKVKQGDVITQDRADLLFSLTLKIFEEGVSRLVTSNINQNQFDSCVCLSYNIGLGAFAKSTLLKLINADPNDPAIKDQFLEWTGHNPVFKKGLLIRRTAESNLYFQPIN